MEVFHLFSEFGDGFGGDAREKAVVERSLGKEGGEGEGKKEREGRGKETLINICKELKRHHNQTT